MNIVPQKSPSLRLSALGHYATYSNYAQKFDFEIKGNFHVTFDRGTFRDYATKSKASSRLQIEFKWIQTKLVII